MPKETTIALIGLRGSGKSTLGPALSAALGLPYFDQDKVIERLAGKSIRELVKAHGWDEFRIREQAAFEWVRDTSTGGYLIATGGGYPVHRGRRALGRMSHVLYLHADASLVWRRIRGDHNRPALTSLGGGFAELERLYKERDATYRRLATVVLDSALPVQTLVTDAVEALRERG